jgi:hypothetical protein
MNCWKKWRIKSSPSRSKQAALNQNWACVVFMLVAIQKLGQPVQTFL